jgi:hypothetical protein
VSSLNKKFIVDDQIQQKNNVVKRARSQSALRRSQVQVLASKLVLLTEDFVPFLCSPAIFQDNTTN